MAITSNFAWVTLRYVWLGQQMQTKRLYGINGTALANIDTVDLAEAWWDYMQGVWRQCAPNYDLTVFRSVLVEEVGGNMGFGEYAIPPVEQSGTRNIGGGADVLPSFMAVGVRFTVGTRNTRPGQMRVPFLHDGDVTGQVVNPGMLGLVNALAELYVLQVDLAFGSDDVAMLSYVPHMSDGALNVLLSQRIVGAVVNTNVTTQNSRKIGRGV